MNYDLSLQHQFSPSTHHNSPKVKENKHKKGDQQLPTSPHIKKQHLGGGGGSGQITPQMNNSYLQQQQMQQQQLATYNTTSINTHHHHNLLQQKSKNNSYSQYIEISEQECISVESVILNNRNSNVHIVVKNTSFVLKIRSLDLNVINFSNSHVKAGLYYANEPMKEVSFIQTPPITYVGSSCQDGEIFSMDIKISILSSQHQGNLFYVMLNVTDAKNTTAGHVYLSHPIRVVSKVDHIKKDPNGGCEKKQTFIDILTERLNTLENIHVAQSSLLSVMLKQRGLPTSEYVYSELDPIDISSISASSSPPSSPFVLSESSKRPRIKPPAPHRPSNRNTAEKFLESFNKVIRVYKEECSNDKKLNLTQLIETLSEDERAILSDLLDSFTFDDPAVKSQSSSTNSSFNLSSFNHEEEGAETCQCEKCPYRKQAEQLLLLSPIMSFQSPSIGLLSPPSTPQHHSHQSPPTHSSTPSTIPSDHITMKDSISQLAME
eukprot:gene13900-16400_t